MQVFRLMGGPDKVIAFDELPERLTQGFELCKADGFPRHWKEWLGKKENVIKIPPEMDVFTKQVRTFTPIIEKDHYFYLVDWNLRPVVERWDAICDFVKRVVPKDFRLTENLEEMAIPLASNKSDGVSIEPEQVVVIPIPLEFQEKAVKIESVPGGTSRKHSIESMNGKNANMQQVQGLGSDQRTGILQSLSQSEHEELAKVTSSCGTSTEKDELQSLYTRLREEGKDHKDALLALWQSKESSASRGLQQASSGDVDVSKVSHESPQRSSGKQKQVVKCDEAGCSFEAEGSYAKNSVRFHKNKKHPKIAASA